MNKFISLLTAVSVSAITAASSANAAIIVTGNSQGVFPSNLSINPDAGNQDVTVGRNIIVNGANTAVAGNLRVDASGSNSTLRTNRSVNVGLDGTTGTLQVRGDGVNANSASLVADEIIRVGGTLNGLMTGTGVLDIRNGGRVEAIDTIDDGAISGLEIASGFSATVDTNGTTQRDGAVFVRGPLSSLRVGDISLGTASLGTKGILSVSGGGTVTTGNDFNGLYISENSEVIIADAGSSLSIIQSTSQDAGLTVGGTSAGSGQSFDLTPNATNEAAMLSIIRGGTVSVAPTLRSAIGDGTQGIVTVDGSGSVFNVGDLSVGLDRLEFVSGTGFTSVDQGNGSLLVQNGGVLNANGDITLAIGNQFTGSQSAVGTTGILTVNSLGQVNANNIFVQNGGLIDGNGGTISANVVLDGGTIAPGNSPGTLTIDGDLNVTSGLLEFEIGGTNSGSYDVLNVLGDMFVNDMTTFSFSFIDGFAQEEGDTFDFLNIVGANNLDLALFNVMTDGLLGDLNIDFGFSNGMFSATVLSASEVPLPAALPFMLTGLAGFGMYSRRNKKQQVLTAA